MLNNLLTLDLTKTTALISWIAVGVMVLVIILLCCFNKKWNTKTLVFAGITTALAYVLSYIKVSPVTYGGSITLASTFPLIVFAYFYGTLPSLLVGVAYGLLQFLQEPYVLTPVTFLLDYVLAFAPVCLGGIFKGKFKELPAIILGASICYGARFISHLASGMVYFLMDAVWADLPAPNAFVYSFLYQVTYLIPDFIITLLALIGVSKTGLLTRLEKLTEKK